MADSQAPTQTQPSQPASQELSTQNLPEIIRTYRPIKVRYALPTSAFDNSAHLLHSFSLSEVPSLMLRPM